MIIHDPNLPWGHWLRLEPSGWDRSAFFDPDGRQWPTVRHALWCGRLSMPLRNGDLPEEQLELLAAALAGRLGRGEGSWSGMISPFDFNHHYHGWLVSVGLLAQGGPTALDARLTDEGLAVLRMLEATRPVPIRHERPGRASVDMLIETIRGPLDGEDRRGKVERTASGWDAAFLRRSIAGASAVILARRGEGPVPVLTTVWSLRLPSERARDGFYDFLCDHLDRWPAWAGIASRYSGPELTQHLLTVMSERQVAPDGGGNGGSGS